MHSLWYLGHLPFREGRSIVHYVGECTCPPPKKMKNACLGPYPSPPDPQKGPVANSQFFFAGGASRHSRRVAPFPP